MPIIELNKVKIHYTVQGSGPPIVFLAGTSLGTFVWKDVIESIGSNFRSIAVDARGSGESDAPRGPYKVESMAEDIQDLFAHLGLERPVLVGHSMGGFIALQLAIVQEQTIGGLVLVSTSASGHPNQLGSSPAAKKALGRTSGSFEEIFGAMIEVGVGSRVKEENPEALLAFKASQVKHPPRGYGFAGQRAAALKFNPISSLNKINCPCVVVHGSEDQVISFENGQELCKGIKGAKFIELERIGHFPQIEAPHQLAGTIADLIEEGPSITYSNQGTQRR